MLVTGPVDSWAGRSRPARARAGRPTGTQDPMDDPPSGWRGAARDKQVEPAISSGRAREVWPVKRGALGFAHGTQIAPSENDRKSTRILR